MKDESAVFKKATSIEVGKFLFLQGFWLAGLDGQWERKDTVSLDIFRKMGTETKTRSSRFRFFTCKPQIDPIGRVSFGNLLHTNKTRLVFGVYGRDNFQRIIDVIDAMRLSFEFDSMVYLESELPRPKKIFGRLRSLRHQTIPNSNPSGSNSAWGF